MRALFTRWVTPLYVALLVLALPLATAIADHAKAERQRHPEWVLAVSVVPIAFKKALFANRAWKAALYVGAANLGINTLGYSTSNEVVGAGYTAGGKTLTATITTGGDGSTAVIDFDDVAWTGATFTARYMLIYDNNAANKEGFVIDFGADQSVSAGTLTIQFPTPDEVSAILRAA